MGTWCFYVAASSAIDPYRRSLLPTESRFCVVSSHLRVGCVAYAAINNTCSTEASEGSGLGERFCPGALNREVIALGSNSSR